MAFRPLDHASPDALEQEVLAEWAREGLFAQTQARTAKGKPFVFFEGPPTANGRPGIHHVFSRTIKDLICRYQAMLGRQVTRIAGWDTHGLAVEIEVEKELKLNGKLDIEQYGVAEFNQRCRESVFRYKALWEELSNRIGYWLDYEKPYITYTNDYIESVWSLLRRLYDKQLLYEGRKVLPYCWRCGTALSSHELAQGYETHKSPSIYVLFALDDGAKPARHLLVWTTTPWTLPSNVAVAVKPDFTYVELEVDGRHVIVEQSIAAHKAIPGATHGKPLGEFPVVATFPGKALVGQRYRQLLDAVPVDAANAFRVVAGDFVTSEEGTGLVHLAPAFGADDYATAQREGLAFVNPVNEAGEFTGTAWSTINGQTVFDANGTIAERLGKEGKLFGRYEAEGYEHSYPFCWRCHSPLIYYARKSWFVRTTAFRDRMVEINRGVDWHPAELGPGRMGEWLENNVDWALSRDRYWGTPLPVWTCDAAEDHRVVIGSYEELRRHVARGKGKLAEPFDPHKPFIDAVTFPCDQQGCRGTMTRVAAVIDAWFDSGAMPFAQWHYPFEHEKEFRAHFPADYICEGLDQTRGWFYSLLAIAAGLEDSPAYRHVIVNGLLLDATGRKMSKHVGNIVDPLDAVQQFGADTVRVYLLASGQVYQPKRFDPAAVSDVALGFLTRLKHTYGFLALYAEDWTPAAAVVPPAGKRPLVDQWLLARLDGVVQAVRTAWDAYDVTAGTRAIMEFCDNDLSNWYVRVNRARFWAPDRSADAAALATLHEALVTAAKLLAPAAPFASDAIHRRLTGRAVHLESFPAAAGRSAPELETAMDAVRRLATLARSAREDVGLRVRQPLARMRVAVPAAARGAALDQLLELLAREVNVKDVTIVGSDAELVKLRAKANYRTLGKVYGKDTPVAAAAVAELPQDALRDLEAGKAASVTAGGRSFTYRPEDVAIERDVVSDWLVRSEGPYVVALDHSLTDALVEEGLAREIVNRVQRMRKDAGYDYATRITLSVSGGADVLRAARAWRVYIEGETLAREFVLETDLKAPDVRETVDLDGRAAVIALKRHAAGQGTPGTRP
jgi:isoleucyl-tRNA synthetase